jgi:hypothetical protein
MTQVSASRIYHHGVVAVSRVRKTEPDKAFTEQAAARGGGAGKRAAEAPEERMCRNGTDRVAELAPVPVAEFAAQLIGQILETKRPSFRQAARVYREAAALRAEPLPIVEA